MIVFLVLLRFVISILQCPRDAEMYRETLRKHLAEEAKFIDEFHT